MISILPSTLEDNRAFFDQYVASLSQPYDDFLEDHILDSAFYSVQVGAVHAGYLAVHGEGLLTQFFMPLPYLVHSQPAFALAKEQIGFTEAYVPTGDALLLALCMDWKPRVELQAYHFIDSGRNVREAEYPRSLLRPAIPTDMPDLLESKFLDHPEEQIANGQVYVLRDKRNAFLGLGLIEPNRIWTDYWGTGMYVHPDYRQKGVGRSIILALKEICRENGKKALPGCWYFNHNSKRTLESSGYASHSRLLRLKFE